MEDRKNDNPPLRSTALLGRFECDQCGACCRSLIIEIDYIDVLREPKLRQLQPLKAPPDGFYDDETGETIVDPDPFMAGAMLACGATMRCPFDNTCDGKSVC